MLSEIVIGVGYVAKQLVALSSSVGVIAGSLGTIALSLSGGAAWLAALLPAPRKDGAYSKVYIIINTLGGNVGNAVNKTHQMVRKDD
jgi:hypothetical protein